MSQAREEVERMPFAKALGRVLRWLREDMHLTQEEMERKSGVPTSALSRLERGTNKVLDLERLEAVASVLGRSVYEVCTLAERYSATGLFRYAA